MIEPKQNQGDGKVLMTDGCFGDDGFGHGLLNTEFDGITPMIRNDKKDLLIQIRKTYQWMFQLHTTVCLFLVLNNCHSKGV